MPDAATAAVLAIGDELILGEKLDTNSAWLAARLGELGARVLEHRTLPDDATAIAGTIAELAAEHDVVVCGGGLGPTLDDCTREAMRQAIEVLTGAPETLVEDPDSLEAIRQWMRDRGSDLMDANRVQALRPTKADALHNDFGTAPGMLVDLEVAAGRRVLASLPGPPREMQPMFEQEVAPRVAGLGDAPPGQLRVVQVFGLGESPLAAAIEPLMVRSNNPAVGTTASDGLVTCRIRSEGGRGLAGPYDAATIDEAMEEAASRIERAAPGHVVGRHNRPLAASLLAELSERGATLATAESCTGGMIGAALTAIPGSSAAYAGGWNTYSNAMKRSQLGVPEAMLDEHGAVSEAVARAMASGARRAAEADLAVSVTGVAGPDGGTSEKPVGTVWIGVAHGDDATEARRFRFGGGREDVRRRSTQAALFLALAACRGERPPTLLGQA
ncbi:MAG: CinA family nicotinamide mononucleotide deamidase-related protein [Planctomycetota bacterium]